MQRANDGFYAMVCPQLDAVEQVTLTGAAPGAESAGQGAVRSGSSRGRARTVPRHRYDYLPPPDLNTNYWFNERERTRQEPGHPQPVRRQPGRADQDSRDCSTASGKAFFFFNYEEFYQPTEATRTRTLRHPMRRRAYSATTWSAGGVTTVNARSTSSRWPRANGQHRHDRPIMSLLNGRFARRRSTTGTSVPTTTAQPRVLRLPEPGNGIDHLPTTRVDFNLTQRHRLSGTYYWQEINRFPDIQNTDDAQFPGFPSVGNYLSYRTVGRRHAAIDAALEPRQRTASAAGSGRPASSRPTFRWRMFQNQGGFDLAMPLVATRRRTPRTGGERRATPPT